MNAVTAAAAPIAIFGDLDGDLWGVVVGGIQAQAAIGRLTDADLGLQPAELDAGDDDVWTLIGAGCDLRVERADASSSSVQGEGDLDPCRVSGSVELDGNRREFDVGGVRSSTLNVDGHDSLRVFGAWFPAGHEIGIVAARPQGAKGHDRDSITVIARGEEHPRVIDPRLSTTYDDAGTPRRIGMELWLGDDPEGELWPRRVAGTSTGSSVTGSELGAYAFECVSRGEPGAGIYLLLRP
ncbi:MAG TPA: hypothetical protein VG293_01770 [Solirubrobacteraceae bacterium]|nr:hypothetical protein [Solirubrobacteraceae bacterium]